jgi:hypothetical protein
MATDATIITEFLRQYAIYTWKRVGFTWNNSRGKLHETTLTQDLVFLRYQLGRDTVMPVELWELRDDTQQV